MSDEFKVDYLVQPRNKKYKYIAKITEIKNRGYTISYVFEMVTPFKERPEFCIGYKWNVTKYQLCLFELISTSSNHSNEELEKIIDIISI